jgi:hydrogenase maturation protease
MAAGGGDGALANATQACRVLPAAPRVGVIGIGNVLLCDEGLGIHAVRAFAAQHGADELTLAIEGGTDPWAALQAASGCAALILVDAVRGGKAPGELYRLALEDVETAGAILSLHGITLFHLLQYERLVGNEFGEVVLLGMEPFSIGPGLQLSEGCSERLAALVEMVSREVGVVRERLAARRGGPHAGY